MPSVCNLYVPSGVRHSAHSSATLPLPRRRFSADRREHRDLGFMRRELEARGGFRPLMHLFPTDETPEGLRLIPWGGLDVQMRGFTRSRVYADALQAPIVAAI